MSKNSIRQARFFKLWMDDPRAAIYALVEQIRLHKLFEPNLKNIKAGDIIFSESDKNRYIYLILDGEVELKKTAENEGLVHVTSIKPGSMFGVMSFFSGHEALTTAVAVSDSLVFRLSKTDVDKLLGSNLDIAAMSRQLLISNLMERYSQVVDLNMQLHKLNKDLDDERRQLDVTLNKLRNAHERLVHQERMATLGQLIAGIAHEINNPVAALESANQYLIELLPGLFNIDTQKSAKIYTKFFNEGLNSTNYEGASNREQLEELKSQFPLLKFSDIRRLIHLSENGITQAIEIYELMDVDLLVSALKYTEAGLHVRRIRITSGRISSLVRSLKRYSKQESTGDTRTELKNGMIDTIQILGNRLKSIQLNLNIPENLPDVHFDTGELNQVWTNLIINACDAINNKGIIEITAVEKGEKIVVSISDNGPGIPEENWDKIFLPHFTTRNSSGNFGLGLGLSITRELVLKNQGYIKVKRSELAGAEFIVELQKAK
ncbi:MAG TPA: hypothetical protein DCE78_11805 [Bacteroidetes bacterium]|nr:hypothetical protein [Bacteroidota bacterium]